MGTEILRVRCGACRHKLRLPHKPGARATCPRCEAVMLVPTVDEVAAAMPERLALTPIEPPKKEVPAPAPKPRKRTRRTITDEVRLEMLQSDPEAPSLDELCGDGPAVEF